ncbi:hypothetical protein BpHYR1_042544 [Brachionus plicatilis]|uniref:Uncharacterized protein n=1 Tax=Brachionus plicatilis TaxID=10195 RepID=A0A3M7PFB0_BRAPC|nr:hypothetical protein BpHYR1_042544 [Brachionus plicatilis]
MHEKSKSVNLWQKFRLKSVTKARTSSANGIDVSKSSFLHATSSIVKAASLDSLDFHVSTKKNEGDMVNYYESDEDLQAKAWMKPSESSDDDDDDDDGESDDSDMPKKIYLKINPVNEQRTTSPDQLNQIGKNLQLKISQPVKKVFRKSYKVDENNNLVESPQSDQPPPLPPLPPDLQLLMNQRVNELNRTITESPCTISKSFTDNEEEMQF